MLGHVAGDDLPAIYQGAHLFLYPTLYEGFGLPVVEAMASGVPVITSNTSALAEVATGYASLVDPLNVSEIADAIVAAVGDEDLRQRLVIAGQKRAGQFSWRRTAEQTLDIYQAAMHDERPTGGVS